MRVRVDRVPMSSRARLGTSPAPPLTPAAWLRFDAIQRGLHAADPKRILEVGTGVGAMGWRLARHYEYEGLEPDPVSRDVASERLTRLGRGRVRPLTTKSSKVTGPYDLVCGFEVLEHIENDLDELVRWKDLLRPDGHVLLSVPAHRHRYGPADQAVGHYRRYDRSDLESLLEEAGFEVVTLEAWGAGLGHVLEWGRHRLAERVGKGGGGGAGGSGRWLQPRGRLPGLLIALLVAPFRILQHPFRAGDRGIGWVALARTRA